MGGVGNTQVLGSSGLTSKRGNNESEWEFIFDVFKKHPQAFNLRSNKSMPQTLDEFKQEFVLDVCEQASLCNEQVRLAVKSHSPLLSIRKPQNNSSNNHAHSSSLSINITSASGAGVSVGRHYSINNNKSVSVVSSPNNSIRLLNHHQSPSSNRSSFNTMATMPPVAPQMRKASASVSPPPAAQRKDSGLLSVQDVQMMPDTASNAGTLGAVSMTPNATNADPNAILLFDKLLDKIVDGLVVNNER